MKNKLRRNTKIKNYNDINFIFSIQMQNNTNVSVAIRMRPFLKNEIQEGNKASITINEDRNTI